MFAESIHSAADSGNQILLLYGSKQSKKKPTRTHQFGYGQERYFYSFIVALAIFLLGGIFALVQGSRKIAEKTYLENVNLGVIILTIALILEILSLRVALKESKILKRKLGWVKFIKTTRNPELPVLILENLAAVIGLVIALAGLIISELTGDPIYDAMATICIGVLLVTVAFVLGIEMKSLLIGESMVPIEEFEIRRSILKYKNILSIIDMRSLHLSPDEVLLAIKVQVCEEINIHNFSLLASEIKENLRIVNPNLNIIYIEPYIVE